MAQLVAHLHDAQGVRGSSPLRPTRKAQIRFFARVTVTYEGPSGESVTLTDGLPGVPLPTESSPTTTTPAAVGSGYLDAGSNGAWFIQWQTNGGVISGTIQIDYIAGTAPNEALSESAEAVLPSHQSNASTQPQVNNAIASARKSTSTAVVA